MAKLQEYKDFSEKGKYFQNGDAKIVINIDAIFGELDKLQKNGDLILEDVARQNTSFIILHKDTIKVMNSSGMQGVQK